MADDSTTGVTPEELIATLRERLLGEIRQDNRRIRLSPADEALVQSLMTFRPSAWKRFRDQLKDAAEDAGWNATERGQFAFSHVASEAKRQRAQERVAEAGMTSSSAQRTREEHQRRRRQEQTISAPETMMDADDPMVRIAGLIMFFRPGRIWWDDFHKTVRLDWRGGNHTDVVPAFSLDDGTVLRIMVWAHSQDYELAGVSKQRFVEAIEFVADLDHRNEVKEFLESLTWDGVAEPERMLSDIYHAEDTAFTRAVSTNVLVAMVARIFEPGCQFDNVMVLIGSQGVFKTQSLRVLGGKWYRSLSTGIDTPDFIRGMHGAWVIELAELSSMTGTRAHAEQTKARISTQVDSQRPLWKNFFRDMPRNSITVGTTNDEHFHYDPTSDDARRYWPTFVCPNGELIELDRLKQIRDQLLARAVMLYKAGHRYWEVPREEQRQQIERVRKQNEFKDLVSTWIDVQEARGTIYDGIIESIPCTCWNGGGKPEDWGTAVTVDRIATQALGLSRAQLRQNNNAHAVGDALKQLGFSKRQRRVAGRQAVMVWRRAWSDDEGMQPAPAAEDPPF